MSKQQFIQELIKMYEVKLLLVQGDLDDLCKKSPKEYFRIGKLKGHKETMLDLISYLKEE
jgi:hypothetical protein